MHAGTLQVNSPPLQSEENHKSLRDVILASFDVRNEGDQELRERIRKDKNLYDDMKASEAERPNGDGDVYADVCTGTEPCPFHPQENLLLAERCLLYMTGFRFSRTPHELLLEELQDLNLWSESEKDPQEVRCHAGSKQQWDSHGAGPAAAPLFDRVQALRRRRTAGSS